MELANLKLRHDLIIIEQSGPEGSMFVVKDPTVDRFFRLKEIEHFIVKQFDGLTSLDTAQKRVEQRFGVSLSKENLDQFAHRLRRIGLLRDPSDSHVNQISKKKIAGDIFYLRFKLFDPDRVLGRLIPYLRFMFTPSFLVSSAFLVLWSVGITTLYWTEIMNQFYGIFRFDSLLLAWVVVIGVVTLHEFAHGLTCKYFGGHVHEMGIMLIYFQPAFFCNVSDAWLFPEKRKKMWVTFAGAYFEIFLWSLATLAWRVTDTSTMLNHFALIVTVTSAFKIFFNLNPLIKFDGYYLLSDWLNIPNLRQRASQYLGNYLRRLWDARGGDASFSNVTPRERVILVFYAILSTVYIYWLLGNIAVWFGGYMVSQYQAWGLIIYASVLGVLFRHPIKKLVSVKSNTNGTVSDGPKPKRNSFLTAGLKIMVPVIALSSIVYFVHADLKVTGEFIVMPQHNADVRAEVEGIIEEVYVDEGHSVEQGALIARLSDVDYNAELMKVHAEIETKQAELKLLKAGIRPEEIELAKTQVAKAVERYNFGKSYYDRDRISVDQKLISPKEFEETKELFAIRVKELEEARKKLETLQAGPRTEEIEVINATIRKLQSHEQYLNHQVNSLLVTSPITGVVTTHKMKEKIGENVRKGDLIAEVFELKTVLVEIKVPEKEIGVVEIGQRVVLKARAYPGKTFEGIVNNISPVAIKPDELLPNRSVLVTTQLSNSSGLLKPQMTGNAKIYCGDRRLFDLFTYRIVRYIRVEFWSWF